MTAAFLALLRRDLLLAFRRRTELLFPVAFLLVVVSLFPLGIGPGPALLTRTLTLIVLAKIIAHWLVAGLPLVLLSPLLAMWMNLPLESLGVLIVTLLLGTPILSLIGSIGVGLTLSLKRGGQLLSLLVFPLYVPILILATAAVMAVADGLPYGAFLGLLIAGLVTSVTLAPFAAAAALKISLS